MSGAPGQLSADSQTDAVRLLDPPEKPLAHERFNAFHLEVGVLSEQMAWIVNRLPDSEPAFGILQRLVDDLEQLLDEQDCRADA